MAEDGDAKKLAVHPRFTELPVTPPANPDAIFTREDFPDKSLFSLTTQHPAISVPVKRTGPIRILLKEFLVKGVKNTHNDEHDRDRRILVLKPETTRAQLEPKIAFDDDSSKDLQWIPKFPIIRTYNDQSADELLRRLLPADFEIPSSYELVGTIAHVNLKEPCWPYKYWIGQVLLERTSAVKTVVNKVGTIDTVYRTFDMEILAGDASKGWSIVKVHEHGSTFQLDYQHVYWNSRLSGEHKRLVDMILRDQRKQSDRSLIVADIMAGVGPFAVPLTRTPRAAKRSGFDSGSNNDNNNNNIPRVVVYANDLNPVSFRYLEINAKANKCQNLHCYNHDARAFLHQLQQELEVIDHVIMNLPASAPEFLDAFRGWSLVRKRPTVHVHCFAPKKCSVDHHAETIRRCEQALGCSIEPGTARIHIVRNVSPSNNMLCVSFPLPEAVTQLERIVLDGEPKAKRAKVEDANKDDDDKR